MRRTFERATRLATGHFSTHFGHALQLLPSQPIRNVLIVKKPRDERVSAALKTLSSHIRDTYPQATLFYEPSAIPLSGRTGELFVASDAIRPPIDLIITLGGDGTILHASSLFSTGPVPPVLSFSLGTLGFLLPFRFDTYPGALKDVFEGRASVLPRMRLSCTLHDQRGSETTGCAPPGWQVMNEVTLHRGRNSHLAVVDTYVNEQHLTEAVADGLILSTPTGSTAYSLSSGGPIVHPSISALLLTPICPMSLSFRPLLLPGSSEVRLRISEKSRAPAELSMDGRGSRLLHPGESVHIQASPHPIPCVSHSSSDWARDINTLLRFNARFKSSAGRQSLANEMDMED